MSRKWLRFPIHGFVQTLSVTAPVTVQDGSPANPHFMQLRFIMSNPTSGPPDVIPLIPGKMTFLADPPTPPKILPQPADIQALTAQEYTKWQTTGTVRIVLDERRVNEIEALIPPTRAVPRVVWYWPVTLSYGFLSSSLVAPSKLPRIGITRVGLPKIAAPGPTQQATEEWKKWAVSGFLNGKYDAPVGMHDTDPLQDPGATMTMPSASMDAAGVVTLWMAIAVGSRPEFDDAHDAALLALASTLSELDPRHPRNALVDTRKLIVDLRSQIIDAEPSLGNVIADAVAASWPTGPRYFTIRINTPDESEAVLQHGLLLTEQVTVRNSAGAVMQQQQLRPSGFITIKQDPPASGQPVPGPPTMNVRLSPGTLKLVKTNGTRPMSTTNEATFDFSTLSGDGSITLQQPGPASPADAAAFSLRLARISKALGDAPATKRFVRDVLLEYEAAIRPAIWPPPAPPAPAQPWAHGARIFLGAREPWVQMDVGDIQALFDGLQALAANPAPPVRPAEAMLTWIVEGKIALSLDKVTRGKAAGEWLLIGDFLRNLQSAAGTATQYTDTGVNTAAEGDVKTLLLAGLCFNAWGLDKFTDTVFSAARGDTVLNLPGPLADDATAQRSAFNAARAAAVAANITPPARAAVEATLTLRMNEGLREFQTTAAHAETMIWLQHAEYLRRSIDPAMPAAAAKFPSFSYMAFNARGGPAAAATQFADAQARLAASPPSWVRNEEDALRSFPLTTAEITSLLKNSQGSSRVNAIKFGAIVRTYGSIFPKVLLP